MGYPTRVQLIQRQESQQWYINFPAPLAQALEFQKGETIEWVIQDKNTLVLHRIERARFAQKPSGAKKKR
jgi:antitoxin component of MazEF toxin-antitoxin module